MSSLFAPKNVTTAVGSGVLHTDAFRVEDGRIASPQVGPAHDLSSAENVAQFVARTLDNAEKAVALVASQWASPSLKSLNLSQ